MPAEVIRKQGLCSALIAYVDDFIGADGGTVEDTHPRATAAVGVLSDFGFLMNQDKQNLNMETRLTALGFLLNTDGMVRRPRWPESSCERPTTTTAASR